jgi:hypothetical protein
MTRFVIGPDVARRLAREKVVVPSERERLAAEAEALVAVAPYASLFDDTGRDQPCTD